MPIVRAHAMYHFGLPVNDLEIAKDFYVNVLGFNVAPERERTAGGPRPAQVRLYCGDKHVPGLDLILFERPKPIERDSQATQEAALRGYEEGTAHDSSLLLQDGSYHNAYVVSPEDLDEALVRFKEVGIVVAAVPRTGSRNRSIYLFDPDGNKIQLSDRPA